MLVDVGDVVLDLLLASGGAAAPACSAPSADRSVLEFETAAYRIDEGDPSSSYVTVTRGGDAAGVVTARVSLAGGSATAGADFETREIDVRFGALDSTPRTIEVPLIDDGDIESTKR